MLRNARNRRGKRSHPGLFEGAVLNQQLEVRLKPGGQRAGFNDDAECDVVVDDNCHVVSGCVVLNDGVGWALWKRWQARRST